MFGQGGPLCGLTTTAVLSAWLRGTSLGTRWELCLRPGGARAECMCARTGQHPCGGTSLGHFPLTSAFHYPFHSRDYLFIPILQMGKLSLRVVKSLLCVTSSERSKWDLTLGLLIPSPACLHTSLSLRVCIHKDLTILHSFLYLLIPSLHKCINWPGLRERPAWWRRERKTSHTHMSRHCSSAQCFQGEHRTGRSEQDHGSGRAS